MAFPDDEDQKPLELQRTIGGYTLYAKSMNSNQLFIRVEKDQSPNFNLVKREDGQPRKVYTEAVVTAMANLIRDELADPADTSRTAVDYGDIQYKVTLPSTVSREGTISITLSDSGVPLSMKDMIGAARNVFDALGKIGKPKDSLAARLVEKGQVEGMQRNPEHGDSETEAIAGGIPLKGTSHSWQSKALPPPEPPGAKELARRLRDAISAKMPRDLHAFQLAPDEREGHILRGEILENLETRLQAAFGKALAKGGADIAGMRAEAVRHAAMLIGEHFNLAISDEKKTELLARLHAEKDAASTHAAPQGPLNAKEQRFAEQLADLSRPLADPMDHPKMPMETLKPREFGEASHAYSRDRIEQQNALALKFAEAIIPPESVIAGLMPPAKQSQR